MSKIFDGSSDSEPEIQTENEYAKNYDKWRKKEELNRLKTKYGEDVLEEESSSSSSDDEEAAELTEEVERQFFKTLSCLKSKDPRIYDENVKFFNDKVQNESVKNKKKKEKPMYINDYERELILTKNGELSDGDDEQQQDPRAKSPTYVEEQKALEGLKKVFVEVEEEEGDEDDDDKDGMGQSLTFRHKRQQEKVEEETDYKTWLGGQKEQLDDKEVETELKPLKDYWNNPELNEGEKFIRDYILKKRFLSKEDEDYIPTYEEIIHDSDNDLSEDEEAIERQEEFEHKYNFRFEEPDQDFIKRYPRSMEHSLRKTDDRRKLKRAETKERKQKEKEQKMEELKKLQELKKKEIEEKIQKLKEITGNDDLEFKDEDFEGDFDPEAHDKKMQSLFNEEFYEGDEGDEKPVFPDIDEYLELENWANYEGEKEENEGHSPHCEDEDFNMDCDYDPQTSSQSDLIQNSKGKKKRKKKSLFAKAVSQTKPVFDPKDKTYEEYLDEYYKLDCEDFIGDLPCKFKYRKVVPNDFGLSVEEILTANDRELNKWCSLKKALQHRPDHVEKYDQIAYAKKASNIDLKKRILPSLFESEQAKEKKVEEDADKKKKKMKKVRCKKGAQKQDEKIEEAEVVEKRQEVTEVEEKTAEESGDADVAKKKNKKKKKKKKTKQVPNNNIASGDSSIERNISSKKRKCPDSANGEGPNKKAKKDFRNNKKKQDVGISDARLAAYGLNPKKFKNKLKYAKS